MTDKQFYILLGLAGVAAFALYKGGEKAVEKAKTGLNPASRDNWVYRATNSLADIIIDGEADGDQVFLDLFDWEMWGR